MTAPTARADLLEAQDRISQALTIVDRVAPSLPEPERGALTGVLGLRADLALTVQRLGRVVAFLEHGVS